MNLYMSKCEIDVSNFLPLLPYTVYAHIAVKRGRAPIPNKFSHILYRNIVPHAHKVHKYKFRFAYSAFCVSGPFLYMQQRSTELGASLPDDIVTFKPKKKKQIYCASERECQGI